MVIAADGFLVGAQDVPEHLEGIQQLVLAVWVTLGLLV